ncbi:MAG TPA: right-handed parallel beta-helix repeat-containing protein [Candidatus Sumerlaeota bacterium]|nr:MAG: hypothetical protein BWY12_01870 [candidate division BRC1 bacterium ADurb.Bin183]HON50346.1 right-handed parallel beta-helix repeat-containing protein [Candidatus Sumerlaeota bacterium]HRR29677.1 right-handed parallel beta-helix repeat-containing protein [Candidatus Sumerlaeia bacterium]HOR63562.1 right-handed parallel beta-helix repeat-containing protein [Candidatus Sumerlaeota bacterium]HPL73528.1 right-handed parallel beta-helix repeat-containing protein [Candidatus Sumerlaeota bacte
MFKRAGCVLALFLWTAWSFAQFGIRVPEDYYQISDAVMAANAGQTVIIGPGVFDGNSQSFPIILRDGVSVEGSGEALTFVDSGATGVPAFTADNIVTTSTLLSRMTIQNGNIVSAGGAALRITNCSAFYIQNVRFRNNKGTTGGAIYINDSTAFFVRCLFDGNRAENGGAVFIEGDISAPVFGENIFQSNESSLSGGALYIYRASDTMIQDSTFTDNKSAGQGGAATIYDSKASLLENVFEGNNGLDGGAICLYLSDSPVQKNLFLKNTASRGGGIFSSGGSALIYGNVFSHNEASVNGAAYAADNSLDHVLSTVIHHNKNIASGGSAVSISNGDTVFDDNTVAHNNAEAGIGISNAHPAVYNNIIAFNTGFGLQENGADADPDCVNNLFYENSSGNYFDDGAAILNSAAEINAADNAPHLSQNNITGDPLFKDPVMGDYHIEHGSAAQDTATFIAPVFAEQDMDLEFRHYRYSGTAPDIGADELIYPRLTGPNIYYDTNADNKVTSGDLVILTFSQAMDSPTTLTAADFRLFVVGDTLGTNAEFSIAPINRRHVILTVGNSPWLTIPGIYDDARRWAGEPSGIDIAAIRPDGLQNDKGIPASPGGLPVPAGAGLDISAGTITSTGFVHHYSSTELTAGVGSYYSKNRFSIPILSSYYQGFLYMKQARQYFGTNNCVAFDGEFPIFLFDPFRAPTLTLAYDESEIDFAAGEREENMRIFRLNKNDLMGNYYFEIVPDALGAPQVVDTANNTVSVRITYLYPPRYPAYDAPVKIPYTHPIYDNSKGIYAVFHVKPFEETQKRARLAGAGQSVTLASPYDAESPFYRHSVTLNGFEEDTSGTVILRMRPARTEERVLLPAKTNAVCVIEANTLDGSPVDITQPMNVSLNFKDHTSKIFHEDVLDENGNKALPTQMTIAAVNPETWTLVKAGGATLQRDYVRNLVMDTIDATTVTLHPSRLVLCALADSRAPMSYGFYNSMDNWNYVSDFEDIFDPGVPGYGPGFLSITCHTANTYSYWENDPDEIPVVEDYVYRARFTVDTDIFSKVNCPSFRLRVNSQNYQMSASLRVFSYKDSYASPTVLYPKTYNLYFVPPASTLEYSIKQGARALLPWMTSRILYNAKDEASNDMMAYAELINLDEEDFKDTTMFFRGVHFDRIPLSELPTKEVLAIYEFSGGTDGWKSGNAYPHFSPAIASQTGQALSLGVADSNTYGFWEKDTEIAITTNTLYRARFFIFTDAPSRAQTPDVRLRITTRGNMFASIYDEVNMGDAMMAPTRLPREYVVYYYPEQEILRGGSLETIILNFDLINLSDKGRGGTDVFLDRVILESVEPPSFPY